MLESNEFAFPALLLGLIILIVLATLVLHWLFPPWRDSESGKKGKARG